MAFSAAVQTSKSDAVLGRGAKAWRAAVAASALSRLGGKGGRLYKADSIRRSRSCFALRSASIGSTHGVMVWARARGQVRAGGRSDEPPVLPTWRLSCCLQIFTKGGSVADKGFFIERLPREGTVTFLALVKEKELRNKRSGGFYYACYSETARANSMRRSGTSRKRPPPCFSETRS